MNKTDLMSAADKFLFGTGQQLENYYIEQTPVSEMLCYRNVEGREFDLSINDANLAILVIARLKELGVEIRLLG